jgi:phosphate transport system substrate-binding protein
MAACLPPKSAPAPQAAPAQAAAIPSPAPAAAPSPKPAQAAAPAAEAAETPLAAQPEPAPLPASLPVYSPDPALPDQGVLTSIGSDSMEPLMLLWFDDYHAIHQRFSSNFICKGSATAPRALIAGNAIMGQMSRQMTQEEWDGFQAKYGYPPTRIVVAMDALAVYVNANNPIPRLGLEQVDAIFGRDRKGGCGKSLDVWGDLGLDQEWTHRAIRAYGRDENSGTRAFFRERVLKNGEYKPTVQAVQDQFALVEAAAMDASAIVYGPIQHKVRMVRAVPIADYGADHAILPTVQNVVNGSYPLARFLYIYLNLPPGKPCDPLVKDFLRFILSRQGQTDVALFGAVPLPADLAALNLDKVK